MSEPDSEQVKASLQHIQSAEQITDEYKPYFHLGGSTVVGGDAEASAELTPSEESQNG
jgi:hypothetical protein